MDFGVEVCACGHPVNKHTLVGTEYARCDGVFAGHHACHCSGGVRAVYLVGIVEGTSSPGNRSGKFFKRDYRVDAERGGWFDTLNRAVEKTDMDSGQIGQWIPGDCDRCGNWWDGDFVGYATQERDSDGDLVLAVELVCGICNFEETHR